jgi:glyceraldehyde 3-phosphate dehydrogenase
LIKIGLNGFGRIGRAITRIVEQCEDCEIVVINEIDPDIENSVYLLKYDSTYGRFKGKVEANDQSMIINGRHVNIHFERLGIDVPWEKYGIDVLIDATGIRENVEAAHAIVERGVPKVVITHSPRQNIDLTIIKGVNEKDYDPLVHHVVSSSICDASAVTPVLFEIDNKWGIENAFVTTLHPWLSYQNLVDGSVKSISSPGHYWKDYSLGRNSTLSLIPKDTTAAAAAIRVCPQLEGKMDAISFRVPTSIVSGSDLTIQLSQDASLEEVKEHFKLLGDRGDDVFEYQTDHLVSIDHLGTNKSAVIDGNNLKVLNNRMIKMVLWYDNEWGYSNRVVDIAQMITKS